MTVHSTCPTCGLECLDYSCPSCLRKALEAERTKVAELETSLKMLEECMKGAFEQMVVDLNLATSGSPQCVRTGRTVEEVLDG